MGEPFQKNVHRDLFTDLLTLQCDDCCYQTRKTIIRLQIIDYWQSHIFMKPDKWFINLEEFCNNKLCVLFWSRSQMWPFFRKKFNTICNRTKLIIIFFLESQYIYWTKKVSRDAFGWKASLNNSRNSQLTNGLKPRTFNFLQ